MIINQFGIYHCYIYILSMTWCYSSRFTDKGYKCMSKHTWCKLSSGIIYTDISDYIPICLVIKYINITKVVTTIETIIYNAQTIATFNDSIDQICWDEVYSCRYPQESYSIFLNEILLANNNSYPLVKKTRM